MLLFWVLYIIFCLLNICMFTAISEQGDERFKDLDLDTQSAVIIMIAISLLGSAILAGILINEYISENSIVAKDVLNPKNHYKIIKNSIIKLFKLIKNIIKIGFEKLFPPKTDKNLNLRIHIKPKVEE